jgi:hypothetical protein
MREMMGLRNRSKHKNDQNTCWRWGGLPFILDFQVCVHRVASDIGTV